MVVASFNNEIPANAAIQAINHALTSKTGAADAKSSIRRLCAAALKETGQREPPFKISPLLRLTGVDWSYEDQRRGKKEAAIIFAESGLRLSIAKDSFAKEGVSRRWRFSVAHEFAHILLIRAVGARVVDLANSSGEAYDYVERLCDYGASHILVPRANLRQALRQRDFSQRAILDLTNLFDVSFQTLMWALADLLPQGGLLLLRKYRRSAQETNELRVWSSYTRYSPGLDELWLPRGCTMKHIRVGQGPLGFANLDVRGPLLINIVLGKRVRKLDASMIEWRSKSTTDSFLPNDRPEYTVDGEKCLLLACAAPGKLDNGLFGRHP
jgi:hypothetical protein